jgi:Na+-transporting methylmalonyl-CoA/oxaloacetate decarboxylase gamma subunit
MTKSEGKLSAPVAEDLSRDTLLKMHEPRFGHTVGQLIWLKTILCFIPNILVDIWTFTYSDIAHRSYYLTEVGVTLVTLTSVLSIYISLMSYFSKEVSTRVLRAYHVIFEITLAAQFIIFVVYWLAVHHTTGELVAIMGETFRYFLFVVHIAPFLCICIDFIISKKVVYMRDLKYMIVFGTVYTFNNFCQTKMFVRRPYPFMTWEGLDSVIAFFIILVFLVISYWLVSKTSQRFVDFDTHKAKKE